MRVELNEITKDFSRVQSNLSELSQRYNQKKASYQAEIDKLLQKHKADKAKISEKQKEIDQLQIQLEKKHQGLAVVQSQHELQKE